jgi:hypothetical protein
MSSLYKLKSITGNNKTHPTTAGVHEKMKASVITPEAEVTPIEQRLKIAVPDRFGLYPHEILLLDYAPKYSTDSTAFPQFWRYDYGIKDVKTLLTDLHNREFLQTGNIADTLKNETLSALKSVATKHELKVSGKKEELINRIIENVPQNELSVLFPKLPYKLTDTGKTALKESEYVPYIHKHIKAGLDIWSLNTLVNTKPHLNYRNKIWQYMDEIYSVCSNKKRYEICRKINFYRAEFMIEEERYRTALQYLASVVYFDINDSLWTQGRIENTEKPNLRAAEYSDTCVPPGIINKIEKCQKEMSLNNTALLDFLINQTRANHAAHRLFTPKEAAEIAVHIKNANDSEAEQIYETVIQRTIKGYTP